MSGEDETRALGASILGNVREVPRDRVQARLKARFLARHPSAQTYAGFTDFRLYRLDLESAHLVAGLGKVHWLTRGDVRFDVEGYGPLAEAEADIAAHMNRDHAEAVHLIATALLGLKAAETTPWTFVGIDPEGADLRAGDRLARFDFPRPVHDAEAARAALVELTRKARRVAAATTSPGTSREN